MATRSIIPLDKNWLFRQADGTSSAQTFRPTAKFPTNIHLDLLAHELIPDPFPGKNEEAVQWVGDKTWIYRTSFSIPADQNRNTHTALVIEGLDTFATVTLDGTEILRTRNMFVGHRVEITDLLKGERDHVLEIIFDDAIERGRKEMEQHPEHAWGVWNGDKSRTAVRKAQYHYGWDWGPKLMTCGPWKPIFLEVYDSRISDLSFNVQLNDDLTAAVVTTTADVEGSARAVRYTLSIAGTDIDMKVVQIPENTASASFKITNPELWWPCTHGSQPLYTMRADLLDGLGPSTEPVLDTATKTFGIRKVELIQRPFIDQEGTSFFFQINNVSMFISGSCWIPADSFTPRLAAQNYRDWVTLAREGNQAMIRVWGGGVYEADAFYEACDELGVLVWQDFMFACANYPAYPEILESIQLEAEQNVKRLRHHPSIVIWAGNNEDYLYMALAGLKYDADDRDPQRWLKTNFPARYIYEYLLPKICGEMTPDVPYHPGSPFGGRIAIDPTIGDIHQWAVWHLDEAPYQDFGSLGGRFVSEFGMQGLPNPKTVDAFFINGRKDKERRVDSSVMSWNNKATGGMDKIKRYLDANLKYSTSSLNSFIYSSQLMQSEALATAYRVWRRDWRGHGREYCAGALVWQLNDCWPTTSWSIADYRMRPKMAFWAVRRESGPFTAGLIRTKDGRLEGWAGNFTLETKKVDVVVRAWDVTTGAKIFDKIVFPNFILESNQSTELPPAALGSLSHPPREHVVVALYLIKNQSTQLARHVNFHEPLKEVPFKKPDHLELNIEGGREGESTWVEVKAEVPVKGLFLDVEDSDTVKWADNGVDLLPGESIRLDVTGLRVGKGHRITAKYLGMEEGAVEDKIVGLFETAPTAKGIQVGAIASSTSHHHRQSLSQL